MSEQERVWETVHGHELKTLRAQLTTATEQIAELERDVMTQEETARFENERALRAEQRLTQEARREKCDKCGKAVHYSQIAIELQDGAPIDDPAGFQWCHACHCRRIIDALKTEQERLTADNAFLLDAVHSAVADRDAAYAAIDLANAEQERLTANLIAAQNKEGEYQILANEQELRAIKAEAEQERLREALKMAMAHIEYLPKDKWDFIDLVLSETPQL